jgi:multidrug transporter EmrE-like cation transporter
MGWLYLLGTIFFATIGQLMIKWRVDMHGAMPEGLNNKLAHFGGLLADPYVLFAFFLAFLSALCWMATVTKFELNFVYPLLIVSLLLLTVTSSTVMLHESITIYKFLGILLISVGAVVLVGSR